MTVLVNEKSINEQIQPMNAKVLTRKPSSKKLKQIVNITLIAWLSTAYADDRRFESLDGIRSTAEEFALQQIDDTGLSNIVASTTSMDSRLHLAKCEIPLEAFSNANARNISRVTVGVRCRGIKPWSIYVPVTINAQANVVYTTRPLVRGESVQSADLELKLVALNQLPANYLNAIPDLVGMEITRSIRTGSLLSLNSLTVKQLIKSGQEVVILARSSKLQVRMSGVALRNGSAGELIPVRNSNSGRTIEAKVLNQNTVIVNM